MSDISVSPIEAFDDNYIWLITGDNNNCAVVDPGDADPVIERLQQQGLNLSAILITHKHYDHVGGVAELKKQWPDAVVYGPKNEKIKHLDNLLTEADEVDLADIGIRFDILEVPGHTEGHIAYLAGKRLFCGDTLFAGGCGRVFSGTFDQLSDSLQRIAALPADTQVYCAHEYTLGNLGFASWVEPDSQALQQRIARDEDTRAKGQSTVPSLLSDELATNPFMRTGEAAVIDMVQNKTEQALSGHRQVFRALREWKDRDYD